MGEVYRAHDTKLAPDVAIKDLPAAFVEDRERLARFEREAKFLAQLNHPNIAHIYGMEASGDAHAHCSSCAGRRSPRAITTLKKHEGRPEVERPSPVAPCS